MLRFLKADLASMWPGLIVFALIQIFMFTMAATEDNWDTGQYISNSMFVWLISAWVLGSKMDKQLRDRMYMTMPLSLNQVAVLRLLFIGALLAVTVLSWVFFEIMSPERPEFGVGWRMLSMMGIGVTVLMLFVIAEDFGHFRRPIYRFLMQSCFALFVVVVVILSIDGGMNFVFERDDIMVRNPVAAGIYLTSALLLTLASIATFRRRDSYLATQCCGFSWPWRRNSA